MRSQMEVLAFMERTVYRAEASRLLRGGGPTAKSRVIHKSRIWLLSTVAADGKVTKRFEKERILHPKLHRSSVV